MTIPPQKMRELVFEFLFSFDFHLSNQEELMDLISHENKASKKNVEQALQKVLHIQSVLSKIDAQIEKASSSYRLERIGKAELSAIRLAIYELCYEKTEPKEVIISEAKRITKKFATKEAASFVHGILDNILQKEPHVLEV